MKKGKRVLSRTREPELDPTNMIMCVGMIAIAVMVTVNMLFTAKLELKISELVKEQSQLTYRYRYYTSDYSTNSGDGYAEKDTGTKKFIGATSIFEWPAAGDRLSELEEGPGHPGINIYCGAQAEIKAADGGMVICAEEKGSCGKTVGIKHSDTCISLYEFCGEITVEQGDEVNKGDCIAKAGYGTALEPAHCHFCINISGEFIDPSYYIENGLSPKNTYGKI